MKYFFESWNWFLAIAGAGCIGAAARTYTLGGTGAALGALGWMSALLVLLIAHAWRCVYRQYKEKIERVEDAIRRANDGE